MKKPDIPSLTGLRFVAAAAIVFDHLWPVIMKLNPGVPFAEQFHQLAFFGMSLFFVMSGFIIHYNYSHSISSARGLYEFGVARFSRLYPLLFVLIAYDVSTGNFFLYQPEQRVNYVMALPYMLTATQSWLYGFIGNHPIAFPYNFSNVAWSISTEFFLYLTYPAICLLAMRKQAPLNAVVKAAIITVMSAVLLSIMQHNADFIDRVGAKIRIVENTQSSPYEIFSDWFRYIAPYPRVLEFLTGCMLAQACASLMHRAPSKTERRLTRALFAAAVANVALFVLRDELFRPSGSKALWSIGLLPAISVLVFCCARYGVKALSYRSIVALGEASYSMYLLHLIVIEKSAPTSFVDPTPENVAILAARSAVVLGVIVVISLGTHRFFEIPARRWLRNGLSLDGAIAKAILKVFKPYQGQTIDLNSKNLQTAHEEGLGNQDGVLDNPYLEGTDLHIAWDMGSRERQRHDMTVW